MNRQANRHFLPLLAVNVPRNELHEIEGVSKIISYGKAKDSGVGLSYMNELC